MNKVMVPIIHFYSRRDCFRINKQATLIIKSKEFINPSQAILRFRKISATK